MFPHQIFYKTHFYQLNKIKHFWHSVHENNNGHNEHIRLNSNQSQYKTNKHFPLTRHFRSKKYLFYNLTFRIMVPVPTNVDPACFSLFTNKVPLKVYFSLFCFPILIHSQFVWDENENRAEIYILTDFLYGKKKIRPLQKR